MRISSTLRLTLVVPALLSVVCCSPASSPSTGIAPHNVLLIIADDIGIESLESYPEANTVKSWPATPHLSALAEDGMVFDTVWATPYCSRTRANILTGRYGQRTGVAHVVTPKDPNSLSKDEMTIPRVLARLGAQRPATAAIGKWHLANRWNGGRRHPNLAGFDHFAGAMGNFRAPSSFFRWTKVVDGESSTSSGYATSENVDDALSWVEKQERPWFLWLAFNAAHWPWQVPPHALLPASSDPRPSEGEYCGARCRAWMIEAMDHEIGRLLDGLGKQREETTILFVGDNGTPGGVRPAGCPYPAAPGRQHMKGTLFNGGLHVPLIVNGPAVADPGSRSAELVHSSDLFATIVELAGGVPIQELLPEIELDSRSLLPLLAGQGGSVREFVFASLPESQYAIRDQRYKLLRLDDREFLFDLGDPEDRFLEATNLLAPPRSEAAVERHLELSSALDLLLASFPERALESAAAPGGPPPALTRSLARPYRADP